MILGSDREVLNDGEYAFLKKILVLLNTFKCFNLGIGCPLWVVRENDHSSNMKKKTGISDCFEET